MNRKGIVNKGDFNRVVLTETIPYETPLIFSNDGFYRQLVEHSRNTNYLGDLFKIIICTSNPTKPLKYKIRKDPNSLRTLSLLHPGKQNEFVHFYKEYGNIICYHCSQSPATIRAPISVGSSYYISNRNEELKKYKLDSVDTESEDALLKHPSSYFAYKGYNRLHKFYDSNAYLSYEKKFHEMWCLDVSKCFDSIYTHTMSWAVKEKTFSKLTKTIKSTFGQKFDALMQGCNDQETNGILIGPEVSRIFAEIILQDVDIQTITNLDNKFKYKYNKDYIFKRYVDDTFIFSNEKKICQHVANEISDQLNLYNLYINEKKIENFSHPFFTKSSIIVNQLNRELSEFYKRLTNVEKVNGEQIIIPTTIFRRLRLQNNFINNIKEICVSNESNYSLVSGYIISALTNQIVKLISVEQDIINNVENAESKYKNCILTLIEIIFFFYSVEPTVNASYPLSKSIILSNRFFDDIFPDTSSTIKQSILELSSRFLIQKFFYDDEKRDGFVPLEKLNIIIAISELGEEYMLSPDFVNNIFQFDQENSTYFTAICALYYIKEHKEYFQIRSKIFKYLKKQLSNLSEIHSDSIVAYIFLDTLPCPYVDKTIKQKAIQLFYKQKLSRSLTASETEEILSELEENYWFVSWKNIDLLNILEKKELQAVY